MYSLVLQPNSEHGIYESKSKIGLVPRVVGGTEPCAIPSITAFVNECLNLCKIDLHDVRSYTGIRELVFNISSWNQILQLYDESGLLFKLSYSSSFNALILFNL